MKQEGAMRLKKAQKVLNREADKLDDKRARGEAYKQSIVKEQENIRNKAEQTIVKLNGGLRAMRVRLQAYLDREEFSEAYYDLRDRYGNMLVEREQLLKTISVCDESITGAKLHNIGDEYVGGVHKSSKS